MHPIQPDQVRRVLIAVALLNSLLGAVVWAGAGLHAPVLRSENLRVAPGWTLYLVVGPIDTWLPSDLQLLAGDRRAQPATVLWLEVWVTNASTRTVMRLVSWRLSLRLLAVLPLGASLVLLVASRRGHWWTSTAAPARSGSPRSR